MTIDELNALSDNQNWQQVFAQPRPAQPKKKKKGFLLDNISTGGSLAGALAGGTAGASLGSIVPGLGTVIGGVGGAILGGAFGGGGGQVAENAIAGDNLMQDVGSEALWGGVTALPLGSSLKLAKAGGTLVKGLGKEAARTAARDLVIEAGVKAMPKKAVQQLSLSEALKAVPAREAAERLATAPTVGQKVAGKLSGVADDMAIKQFRLAPGQISSFKKLHGEDPGALIRRVGISSVDDVATKGIEPLQNAFDTVVKTIPAVSSKELDNGLKTVYQPLMKSGALFEQQLGRQLKSQADELIKFSKGGSIPAEQVNELRRTFDSAIKYTQKGAPDANVAKETADALRSILQKSADSAGIKSADGRTFKEIGLELSKLYQLDDLVKKQGELGRGSLPMGIIQGLSGVAGGAMGGIPGAMAGYAVTSAINSPQGRRAILKTVEGAAGKLSSQAPRDIGQSLAQAATRIGGIGAGRTFLSQSDEDQSLSDPNSIGNITNPQNITSPTTTNVLMASNMSEQYPEEEQMSSPLGYSSMEIGQALMRAYADGNSTAAKQLEGMYQLASEWEQNQVKQEKPLTEGQQMRADLIRALDLSEGAIGAGSINYGPIGSRVEGIKGALNMGDDETLNFKATIGGLRGAIAKARAGTSMTPGETAMLDRYTPSDTDSEQVIRTKLQALRQLYGGTMPQGGGSGDLASALQAAGY